MIDDGSYTDDPRLAQPLPRLTPTSAETDTLPWKVFLQNGVLAIFSRSEREIIHWSGFDASSFDDTTNLKHATLIVEAVNNYASLQSRLSAQDKRVERLREVIKDSIESLERNSTSAPVVECLRAALTDGAADE